MEARWFAYILQEGFNPCMNCVRPRRHALLPEHKLTRGVVKAHATSSPKELVILTFKLHMRNA